MENRIHKDVQSVISETHIAYHAYSHHEYMNADFADFATLSLSQFRAALQRPDLSRENLEHLLRGGMVTHRRENMPASSWTGFMAQYISSASNSA